MQRSKGQSFLEYVLIGILVLTISIGALTLLGGNINKVLGSIMAGAGQTAVTGKASNPASTSASAAAGGSVNGASSTPSGEGLPRPITLQTLPNTSADFIMTMGVNGASQTALALTDLIAQSAKTYQKTDPAVYNAVVQLGLKGQEMAQMMKACESGPCDTKALDNFNTEFNSMYNDAFLYSDDLQKKMKPEDIKLIANLTNQSEALADDLVTMKSGTFDPNAYHAFVSGSDGNIIDYPVGQPLVNPSATVNSNSVTTQQCGQAMACPK